MLDDPEGFFEGLQPPKRKGKGKKARNIFITPEQREYLKLQKLEKRNQEVQAKLIKMREQIQEQKDKEQKKKQQVAANANVSANLQHPVQQQQNEGNAGNAGNAGSNDRPVQ